MQGKHPSIKHGLGHTKRSKINGRKIVNDNECVQFERKDRISTDQPAQPMTVPHNGSVAMKGGSAMGCAG